MDAFDKELAEQSEQGSGVWVDARAGRFTASEIYKLMKSGSRLMTPEELKNRPKEGKGSKAKYIEDPYVMSDETLTYIRKKVAEVLTGVCDEPYSTAMSWGVDLEPQAAEFFTSQKGIELEPISFRPIGDHAGGSPDRKVIGKKEIVEIKCPYFSANQVGYLSLVDQWDLKRENPEYYWQCMANIYFWDADICHFVTYDPRMKENKHKLFHMIIKPEAEAIDLINIKIASAVKEKLYLLNSLK